MSISRSAAKTALLVAVAMLTPGLAISVECPVDANRGASAPPYAKMGNRCEGFLPLFVASGNRIELLGLHRGELVFDGPRPRTVFLRVAAKHPSDRLAIRATFRSKQAHYQMDTLSLTNGGEFEWDQALVAKAGNGLIGLDQFAFLACDNNCRHGPSTTYWPVAAGGRVKLPTVHLYAVLRTSVDATGVTVRLRPASGDVSGAAVRLDKVTLRAGAGTAISLPPVPQGSYDLVVNANDAQTDDSLVPLFVRINLTAGDE